MSEKNFWNLIRNNLDLKMYRVENRVSSGMPDVHYVSENGSGWIELKYIPEFPLKGKMKTGIRQSQYLWHEMYKRHGGKSWVLVRVGRRGVILVKGGVLREVAKGISVSDVIDKSSWSHMGNLEKQDWENLKGVINGKDEENFRDIGEGK
tara:strand:- start:111 stop:560 length:450 start_codon:yes stop_codon:yes gene_type:complete